MPRHAQTPRTLRLMTTNPPYLSISSATSPAGPSLHTRGKALMAKVKRNPSPSPPFPPGAGDAPGTARRRVSRARPPPAGPGAPHQPCSHQSTPGSCPEREPRRGAGAPERGRSRLRASPAPGHPLLPGSAHGRRQLPGKTRSRSPQGGSRAPFQSKGGGGRRGGAKLGQGEGEGGEAAPGAPGGVT